MWHRRERKRRPAELVPTTTPRPTLRPQRHGPSPAEWQSGEPGLMLHCLARLATDNRIAFHLTARQVGRKLRLFYCACARLRAADLTPELNAVVERVEARADTPKSFHRLRTSVDAVIRSLQLTAWQPDRQPGAVERFHAAVLVLRAVAGNRLLRRGAWLGGWPVEPAVQAALLRDLFGDVFAPVVPDPRWFTPTVVRLARLIHDDRAFDLLPVLADALEEAGCSEAEVIDHCRGGQLHVRGCWVIDLFAARGT